MNLFLNMRNRIKLKKLKLSELEYYKERNICLGKCYQERTEEFLYTNNLYKLESQKYDKLSEVYGSLKISHDNLEKSYSESENNIAVAKEEIKKISKLNSKINEDNSTLRAELSIMRKFINPKARSIEELKDFVNGNFDIYMKDNIYYVPTGICSIGGCYIDELEFYTEIDAYRKAAELVLEGVKMHSGTCLSCYSDYLQECM